MTAIVRPPSHCSCWSSHCAGPAAIQNTREETEPPATRTLATEGSPPADHDRPIETKQPRGTHGRDREGHNSRQEKKDAPGTPPGRPEARQTGRLGGDDGARSTRSRTTSSAQRLAAQERQVHPRRRLGHLVRPLQGELPPSRRDAREYAGKGLAVVSLSFDDPADEPSRSATPRSSSARRRPSSPTSCSTRIRASGFEKLEHQRDPGRLPLRRPTARK